MTLRIDVWSDIACPWCWVGKRRLEAALAQVGGDDVEVHWRAFELDPSAPPSHDPGVSYVQRLARKYRASEAHAEGMIRNMTATAANDGITMRFDHIRSGNMFDGHRVLHLAAEAAGGGVKVQNDLKERLFRAYLQDGEVISDPETLVRHATAAGLDPDEVRATLGSDRYAEAVREDEARASALGITGVPFFVIGRYGVSGAQPAETLAKVIEKARSEQVPVMLETGAVCGPDGCA